MSQKKQIRPGVIEVDSIIGRVNQEEEKTPDIPKLFPKKDETEEIVEKAFSKHPLYEKPQRLKVSLNTLASILRLKGKNLLTLTKFYTGKIIKPIRDASEIPVFIVIHGLLGWSVLIAFLGFQISKLSIVHIIACGSVYYFIYDLLTLLKTKRQEIIKR